LPKLSFKAPNLAPAVPAPNALLATSLLVVASWSSCCFLVPFKVAPFCRSSSSL